VSSGALAPVLPLSKGLTRQRQAFGYPRLFDVPASSFHTKIRNYSAQSDFRAFVVLKSFNKMAEP
jgi:hypothetical protein